MTNPGNYIIFLSLPQKIYTILKFIQTPISTSSCFFKNTKKPKNLNPDNQNRTKKIKNLGHELEFKNKEYPEVPKDQTVFLALMPPGKQKDSDLFRCLTVISKGEKKGKFSRRKERKRLVKIPVTKRVRNPKLLLVTLGLFRPPNYSILLTLIAISSSSSSSFLLLLLLLLL